MSLQTELLRQRYRLLIYGFCRRIKIEDSHMINGILRITYRYFYDLRLVKLSTDDTDANVFEEMKMNDEMKQVYINGRAAFFVTVNNHLYVAGDNEDGQLGLCQEKQFDGGKIFPHNLELNEFFENISNKNILNISNSQCFNSCHTYLLLTHFNDTKLYSFGNNWYKQCAVDSESNVMIPQMVDIPFKSNIIQIENGREHSLFLTQYGKVYGVGHNRYYQLGLPKDIEKVSKLTLLDLDGVKIIKIRASMRSSFFVDANNDLYDVGYKIGSKAGLGMITYQQKVAKSEYLKKNNIKVENIYCGDNTVYVISMTHELYVWGSNLYCQCGEEHRCEENPMNLDSQICAPKRLRFADKRIVEVYPGQKHCFAKDEDGGLWAFGRNDQNQCLIKDSVNGKAVLVYHTEEECITVPTLIDVAQLLETFKARNIRMIYPSDNSNYILVD